MSDTKAETLNQVLLHPDRRFGADLETWLIDIGGEGLEKAIEDPGSILPTIRTANLLGLGGSGFPTHVKWEFIASQPNDQNKYLICNGNEDEPGTFKDRILLKETPHQVIEGAMITALATGVNQIVFYINPEQTGSLEAMKEAVNQWDETRYIHQISKLLGRPLEFYVVASSGHYIGGEETAAIESIEGKFPFPRGKPPYPAQQGLFDLPSLINNTETLSNVSHIMRNGAEWFINQGAGAAHGTKIFSLSGDVLYPGAYELPMGTPLSELIYHHGGGMLLDRELKAVFTGGPSNTILTPKDLDVPLDFDSVQQRRSSLGTGAMIVISEGTGIVRRVTEYVSFFANASCGQCPSCKTGTYFASQLLTRIDSGNGSRADLDTLINLTRILPGSGRCHLLDGAMKLLDSSLYHFMEEYEQPLRSS
ncbi:MAG: NADH-quinone oxidoreductase subunit F [Gammaproteobacteria bacterium]|jgi:NADH-quinone oxidoreductase subunit F|nr:NADH-quinone oxidoreductase subunit F [Gammaproteobacteria bacterium]MBT3488422.1 NADH-quinone oxidoreductase subunit F [Gammaproteobacteria bacterium]MBT3718834.1 NADH-quinone oxidoreductase subunit F [Gammaproteobacteria bacterium]MBT3845852.1 NADH-quinone oxidoreductase subunit F [Gammaproteobacteria bacterium]MBT4300298.1 NADH-quinone oxidoreductase subunit F [Gammaproteobacteria bacterium]